MKTVGIIGGVGPESTIEYYRFIIAGYRERNPDGSYPLIIINSVDLDKYLTWIKAGEMEPFTNSLVVEIDKLARAGADFAVLASNTPHIVFDEIRERSPLPLISIVETTRDKAQKMGMNRVGLFGTRFTMKGGFYQKVFAAAGLTIIAPNEQEQAFIHEKYLGELLNNIFLPETRESLLAIAGQMSQRDAIEGLILGGTELPLIMRDDERSGIPFLDTTRIHAERIVEELLS
jgi:aspartate racemase